SLGFVSASTTVGTCSQTQSVVCLLGTLGSGVSATVHVTAKVRQAGALTDAASAVSTTADPDTSSNVARTRIDTYVEVIDFAFDPQATRTALGQAVNWLWTGFAPHTVTDDTGLGLYDSAVRQHNGTF